MEMRVEEIDRCQINKWYPKFKGATFETIFHELPECFIEYLNDAGPLVLPTSCLAEDALPNRVRNVYEEDDFQVKEDSEDEAGDVDLPSFPKLERSVKGSIDLLGGAVLPKLNWSVPKDAAWISSIGSLKCTSFSEIVLLLKSFDSLNHDLGHAYDGCVDKSLDRPVKVCLALRKWYRNLRPEMEFRCFIQGNKLVGISQREVTAFYPALVEKDGFRGSISRFFSEDIKQKFESEAYTFDVYVISNGLVKLMDFNPWDGSTIPLLFDWEDFENIKPAGKDVEVEFRVIESQCTVRPGLKTAVPFDYLDTSEGSGWDEFLRKTDAQLQEQIKVPEPESWKMEDASRIRAPQGITTLKNSNSDSGTLGTPALTSLPHIVGRKKALSPADGGKQRLPKLVNPIWEKMVEVGFEPPTSRSHVWNLNH